MGIGVDVEVGEGAWVRAVVGVGIKVCVNVGAVVCVGVNPVPPETPELQPKNNELDIITRITINISLILFIKLNYNIKLTILSVTKIGSNPRSAISLHR